jgi:chromosome segregation ATPase
MISENASVKFAEFVKQLCDTFNRQTIMVTHNENLQAVADKTNVVILQNDVSVVIDSDSVVPNEGDVSI